MRKILLVLVACFSVMAQAWAASSITIAKAGVGEVLNFTAEFYGAINPGFVVVQKGEQSVILAGKRQAEDGSVYVQQVRFVAEPKEADVQLQLESVKVQRNAAGKTVVEPVHQAGPERFTLCLIKGAFNDHYNFGYVLSTNYRENGFVIDAVEPETAAFKAGLQQGDFLTQVNGVALKQEDEGLYNDKALESCFTGEETEFTVVRGKETLKLKVKPELEAALLKR